MFSQTGTLQTQNMNSHITQKQKKANWHPRYEFQEEAEFYLGQSGPGTPKNKHHKNVFKPTVIMHFM